MNASPQNFGPSLGTWFGADISRWHRLPPSAHTHQPHTGGQCWHAWRWVLEPVWWCLAWVPDLKPGKSNVCLSLGVYLRVQLLIKTMQRSGTTDLLYTKDTKKLVWKTYFTLQMQFCVIGSAGIYNISYAVQKFEKMHRLCGTSSRKMCSPGTDRTDRAACASSIYHLVLFSTPNLSQPGTVDIFVLWINITRMRIRRNNIKN